MSLLLFSSIYFGPTILLLYCLYISGLLIGAGVGIYPNGWDSSEIQQACGFTSQPYYMGTCSLYWSFYLTGSGAALTLISSVLSCHASKRKTGLPAYTDM